MSYIQTPPKTLLGNVVIVQDLVGRIYRFQIQLKMVI
jgi:hypothetical protein